MAKRTKRKKSKKKAEEFLEFALPHDLLRKEGTSSRETAIAMIKGVKQRKKTRAEPGLWKKPGFGHLREQLLFEAYMEGIPNNKIAEIFGITTTHIKMHVYMPYSMRGPVTKQEKYYLQKRGAQWSWDKMSKKEQQKRKKGIKKGQESFWKNLSKKDREELGERKSEKMLDFWAGLSEKEKENMLRGLTDFQEIMSPEDWSKHSKGMRKKKTSKELEEWYGRISEAKAKEWEEMDEKERGRRIGILVEGGKAFWEELGEKDREAFVEDRREESRYWFDRLPKKKQKKLKDIYSEHLVMLGHGEDPRIVSASMSVAMTEFWEGLVPKYRRRKPPNS